MIKSCRQFEYILAFDKNSKKFTSENHLEDS